MRVTDELVHEHEVIKRMLTLLETASRRMQQGEPLNKEFFSGAVKFLREFADTCHHGKEEKVLFPVLEQVGVPTDGGPIGQMLTEHERGRKFIAAMADGAEKGDKELTTQAALQYTGLLRDHIVKENEVLFPLAEKLLVNRQQAVKEDFDRIENEVMGAGAHDRLLAELHRLETLLE